MGIYVNGGVWRASSFSIDQAVEKLRQSLGGK
jgi:hypothetical protein